MKYLKVFESHYDYLKWKRKNVTIRGIQEIGKENEAGASFGTGLYTAFLGNKEMARKYGKVHFLVNAIPKHPKVFNNVNEAEMWLQQNLYYKNYPNKIEFDKNTNIRDEMLKLGYDGLVIRGREMVNYTPPDNILYFTTEEQLENYYDFHFGELSESIKFEKLAPNGKKSNLTSEQYKLVRTPEFKDWFGDWENSPKTSSKIVDENGEPLICYHKTKNKFNTFNIEKQKNGWLGKGFYFTDNKKNIPNSYGKICLTTFLNIRNPFIVKGEGPSDVDSEINKKYNTFNTDVSITLKENGHDGVFFKHWNQGNIFSCFYPNQIKLTD